MNMPKVQTLLPKRNANSDDLKMQNRPKQAVHIVIF